MSQDVVEVQRTLLLRRKAFSHQVEDSEAVLLSGQVDQARLLQHVRVHVGFNRKWVW